MSDREKREIYLIMERAYQRLEDFKKPLEDRFHMDIDDINFTKILESDLLMKEKRSLIIFKSNYMRLTRELDLIFCSIKNMNIFL